MVKDHGILRRTDGPFHNAIQIKPPLVFSRADAASGSVRWPRSCNATHPRSVRYSEV
jgi:4-aminobutyrate aminotransferase-like enzyme